MSTSYRIDHLPENVLSLSGYEFSNFIKATLGKPEADLLEIISVKTTASFLLTENPLDILNYDVDDEDLQKLKDHFSFKLKNQQLMIKPGVISGFNSLRNALRVRYEEQSKKPKKRQQQKQQASDSSGETVSPPSPPTQAARMINKLSLAEHKTYVLSFIKKWCSEYGEEFGLATFNLEENVDFTLHLELDENFDVKATIKCQCGRLISLARNDAKIQVSNYYKHLQSLSCSHMKEAKKAATAQKSVQESPFESALSVPSAILSHSQRPSSHGLTAPSTMAETRSQNTPATSVNSSVRTGKRKLTSQSQQHPSSKRSRT